MTRDAKVLHGIKHDYFDRLWLVFKRLERRILDRLVLEFDAAHTKIGQTRAKPATAFEARLKAMRRDGDEAMASMLELYREQFQVTRFGDLLFSSGIFADNLILRREGLAEVKPLVAIDAEYVDEVSRWLEDSMLYVAKREDFEQTDPLLLTLFRFLGINHRLNKPTTGEPLKADGRLVNKLHRAICDKAADYFSLPLNN